MPGSQTLARGLTALQSVAATPRRSDRAAGRRPHRRAPHHRLPAADHAGPVPLGGQGDDGRYRPAAGLAVLGASFDNNLRQLCLPTLRALADELGTTVSLLVAEGDQQVAIAVIVPTHVFYQLSFHEGSRYPLERGAAGHRAAGQHAAAARRTRPGHR